MSSRSSCRTDPMATSSSNDFRQSLVHHRLMSKMNQRFPRGGSMLGDRYLEPEVETMSRERLHELHEQRVLELVPRAYENSAFYRELWDTHGVRPQDIRSL